MPDHDGSVPSGALPYLSVLRERGPSTAVEVALALGVGAVAARARLRSLEAGGWIERGLERRPVGRPVSRFRLTRRADGLFPKRYDELATRLIGAILAEGGADALERILQRWEDELAAALDAGLPREPRARLEELAAHQSRNGFMAAARSDAEGVALIERNCPVLAAAIRHPEICRHEAALFSRTLHWKTALVSCQATGDSLCVFRVARAPTPGTGPRPSGPSHRKE